jgi:hypothetical protein
MTPAQVTGVIATQRRPRPRMRGTYTPAPRGYGTCSLLTNWARTSWTGTSSRDKLSTRYRAILEITAINEWLPLLRNTP